MKMKDLLRHRQAWVGFAMLWIILYHLPVGVGALNLFKVVGYGGVDICLFASGAGCFYSLASKSDVGTFMHRRILRLMPTYVVFMLFWLGMKVVCGGFSWQMALGNLLALQHFSGHNNAFNWYVGAIFLYYMLAPYLKSVIDSVTEWHKYLFLVFLILCTIPFWGADVLIIVVTRLPVFYIGMLFANACQRDKTINTWHIVGAVIIFVAGVFALFAAFRWATEYRWSHGLFWYPFILITPPLCVAGSALLVWAEKYKVTKPLESVLSLCGDYSFELYLVHLLWFELIPILIDAYDLTAVRHVVWGAGIVAVVISCHVLRRLSSVCERLIGKILPNKTV